MYFPKLIIAELDWTALFTALLCLIGGWQLRGMNKTSKSEFIFKLKDSFFTSRTRKIIQLLNSRELKFVDNEDLNKTRFKRDSNEFSISTYDMDDNLLRKLEDVGLFYNKGVIPLDMTYEEFRWYVESVWENNEIQKYIQRHRIHDNDFGIYSNLEDLYKSCKVYEGSLSKKLSGYLYPNPKQIL